MMNYNQALVAERLQLDEAAAIAVTALIISEGMEILDGIDWAMEVLSSPADKAVEEVGFDMSELFGNKEKGTYGSFHMAYFDKDGRETICTEVA